jgi:hypothetical protein
MGELRFPLPVGYMYDDENNVIFDIDAQVIVELARIVTPILIDNKCLCQRTQLQQTVPICRASGKTGSFQFTGRLSLRRKHPTNIINNQ